MANRPRSDYEAQFGVPSPLLEATLDAADAPAGTHWYPMPSGALGGINTLIGTAETLVQAPAGARALMVHSEGTTNNHGMDFMLGDYVAKTMVAADLDADTLTVSGHGYTTGDGPHRARSDDTIPAGLASGTSYYVEVVDTDTIKLHLTHAAALAGGTPVNITNSGTGSHTFGGFPDIPAASVTDGWSPIRLKETSVNTGANWACVRITSGLNQAAPRNVTFRGQDNSSNIRYWWV